MSGLLPSTPIKLYICFSRVETESDHHHTFNDFSFSFCFFSFIFLFPVEAIYCPPLKRPDNGKLKPFRCGERNNNKFNDTCSLSCNPGYIPENPAGQETTCLENGTWSNPSLTGCKRKIVFIVILYTLFWLVSYCMGFICTRRCNWYLSWNCYFLWVLLCAVFVWRWSPLYQRKRLGNEDLIINNYQKSFFEEGGGMIVLHCDGNDDDVDVDDEDDDDQGWC